MAVKTKTDINLNLATSVIKPLLVLQIVHALKLLGNEPSEECRQQLVAMSVARLQDESQMAVQAVQLKMTTEACENMRRNLAANNTPGSSSSTLN